MPGIAAVPTGNCEIRSEAYVRIKPQQSQAGVLRQHDIKFK